MPVCGTSEFVLHLPKSLERSFMPRRYQPVKKKNNTKMIVAGVIVAVVLVAGLVVLNNTTSQPLPTTVASTSRDWGSPNAPVTIEEYSDFQ